MKKRLSPGSPWRPARPLSWLSIRRDSWRSVPSMNRPPACLTSSASSFIAALYSALYLIYVSLALRISSLSVSAKPVASLMRASSMPSFLILAFARYSALPPSIISVPRPAMLVAIVTAPFLPACATISASRSWFFAFSTSCFMPFFLSIEERSSDFSIVIVPTSTGWPLAWHSSIWRITALYLPSSFLYTWSSWSILAIGLLVGISITSSA